MASGVSHLVATILIIRPN